jgi:hypothetical protein
VAAWRPTSEELRLRQQDFENEVNLRLLQLGPDDHLLTSEDIQKVPRPIRAQLTTAEQQCGCHRSVDWAAIAAAACDIVERRRAGQHVIDDEPRRI